MEFAFLKELIQPGEFPFRFSICTLVTRTDEYHEMVSSCIEAGFIQEKCEYLYIDNSKGNNLDAYQGLNLFLRQARGEYIILCHQDILFNKDRIDILEQRLTELTIKDPDWGLCGNAGAAGPNHIVYHISYPDHLSMDKGKFPVKVSALDENFILVKNKAMLTVSPNLKGFHLYATDLCLHGELQGFSSYVIAFNLTHKSRGNKDHNFVSVQKLLRAKYNHFFRNRWIQTPSTVFFLSGSHLRWLYANPVALFIVRMINGLKKRMK